MEYTTGGLVPIAVHLSISRFYMHARRLHQSTCTKHDQTQLTPFGDNSHLCSHCLASSRCADSGLKFILVNDKNIKFYLQPPSSYRKRSLKILHESLQEDGNKHLHGPWSLRPHPWALGLLMKATTQLPPLARRCRQLRMQQIPASDVLWLGTLWKHLCGRYGHCAYDRLIFQHDSISVMQFRLLVWKGIVHISVASMNGVLNP